MFATRPARANILVPVKRAIDYAVCVSLASCKLNPKSTSVHQHPAFLTEPR
jgi:hypothetical protein